MIVALIKLGSLYLTVIIIPDTHQGDDKIINIFT